MTESLLGLVELLAETGCDTKFLEFHPFQIVPVAFVGVLLRFVSRELLQVDTRRRPICRKLLHDRAAMNRGSVPQSQQLAWDVAQHVPETVDYIRPLTRLLRYSYWVFLPVSRWSCFKRSRTSGAWSYFLEWHSIGSISIT